MLVLLLSKRLALITSLEKLELETQRILQHVFDKRSWGSLYLRYSKPGYAL